MHRKTCGFLQNIEVSFTLKFLQQREREREREREERQRDRETERQRETETERQRETDRQRTMTKQNLKRFHVLRGEGKSSSYPPFFCFHS